MLHLFMLIGEGFGLFLFFLGAALALLMTPAFLNWFIFYRPWRMIYNEHGDPYLLRVKLIGYMPGMPSRWPISIYLHLFLRPDEERAIHNHPWLWSASLILVGAYTEERLHKNGTTFMRTLTAGDFNLFSTKSFHRISELHGREVWSLFVTGPRFQDWGFREPDGTVVSHADFFKAKGIPH